MSKLACSLRCFIFWRVEEANDPLSEFADGWYFIKRLMFSLGKPALLGCPVVKLKAFVKLLVGSRAWGDLGRQWCSRCRSPLCLCLLLHRPMSGIRMMIGCCRLWRMEMPRRWPHCWARKGPVPPSMTARARPRKRKDWLWPVFVKGWGAFQW